MKPTLNNCLPDLQEEIDFLQEIARSVSKKYKREIILSWEDGLEGIDFNKGPIFMVKQDSVCRMHSVAFTIVNCAPVSH